MKLKSLFFLMDVLTMLVYPVLFLYGKLLRLSTAK